MPARPLDAELVEHFVARAAAIPEEREPAWGAMHAADVVPHLLAAVRGSMGALRGLPVRTGFVRRHVIFRLLVWGLLRIPQGVQIRDARGRPVLARDDGSLADLRDAMHEFVARRVDGTLTTAPHPLFGDIGPHGWARFHTLHVEHHLTQFGV